jgi:ABC-type nitrate/sulfonate/bicarbonate transport system ATPase subunit
MDALVTARNLSKSFGVLEVLHAISLDIQPGERVALMGPSGAGKTTLLKIIAGLELPGKGSLVNRALRSAFVFQESRLIPWRSVRDNLLFVNGQGDYRGVLRSVEMEVFEDYLPAALSGGMRQRVNLARALITNPDLLILDEAFRSIDLNVKLRLMKAINRRWEREKFTLLCVTHDPREALYLADRIILLSARPASVLQTIGVDLEKSRDISSVEFLSKEASLIHQLADL